MTGSLWANAKLHACLTEPVNVKDVFGDIKGVMSFPK